MGPRPREDDTGKFAEMNFNKWFLCWPVEVESLRPNGLILKGTRGVSYGRSKKNRQSNNAHDGAVSGDQGSQSG